MEYRQHSEDGLHLSREGMERMAAHMASELAGLPKPTYRERVADWLERLAYRIRRL